MFTQIKTSLENKEVVSQLTRKLNLGKENVIARIALTYSLSQDRKLNLSEINDSGGKEYSEKVLLGEYADIYISLICTHYNIYKTDKDISKYIKMHIDDGLQLIDNEMSSADLDGFDYIIDKIKNGLEVIK